MSEATLIKLIDTRLNGHGAVIVEEAEGRLDLSLACALVEVESNGFNIFGCDHGDTGHQPPWCHQSVTKERVQALRTGGAYGHGMNGVGLTQLTWWEFVEQAEGMGGAHLPRYQCRVGFQHLCGLILDLGYALGIGAYNAGRGNAQLGIDNGYYDKIAAAHEGWKTRLGEGKTEWPTRPFKVDEKDWATDDELKFLRAPEMPNRQFKTNANGWLYAVNAPAPKPPLPPMPNPVKPPKRGKRHPGSGPYVEAHPTHFGFRDDIRPMVDRLEAQFDVYVNTYRDHPPGYWRDVDSFDVWHMDGRGVPLPYADGAKIFRILIDDPNPPNIEWLIYRRRIYGAWNSWAGEPFGSNAFEFHDDHIHVTYEVRR